MKLGSLFDGSGGFPLAGVLNGITPVWASEIEPYPVRVTTARFPAMKHLGDVTKIDGAAIEPVDIITFGSPCQDLSVAGKQAGLHNGERSSLFFEAIRIIKEMRESTDGIYPRIAVWENVPGAYSSNKGEDFRAVLQAFVRLREQAADVPMPKGNKWATAGCVVGNGYSIAWRTLDAQYNGVPQRRRRIYLIADFGSERAGEILFEQEGLRGHSAESGTAGQSAAGDAAGSVDGSGVRCLNPWDCQSKRIFLPDGIYPTLPAMGEGGANNQAVIYAAGFKYGNSAQAHGIGWQEEVSPTLQAGEGGNQKPVVCYALQGNGIDRADTAGCNGAGWRENECYTLNTIDRPAVAYSVDCRNMNLTNEHGTLQAKENGGQSLNYMGAVCYPIDSHQQDSRFKICEDGVCPTVPGQMGTGGNNGPMVLEVEPVVYAGVGVTSKLNVQNPQPGDPCPTLNNDSRNYLVRPAKPPRRYIIRRLTPLECLRLQGLPDGWLDGVDGSDSAKYKMLGNGIAMPNAIYVVGCAVQLLQEGKHENEG